MNYEYFYFISEPRNQQSSPIFHNLDLMKEEIQMEKRRRPASTEFIIMRRQVIYGEWDTFEEDDLEEMLAKWRQDPANLEPDYSGSSDAQ